VSNNGTPAAGGGVFSDGTLTITNSTLSGNSARYICVGGAVYSFGGMLTIANSTVSDNYASYGGGGISDGGGTITDSTVSGNTVSIGGGGGIDNGGTLTITHSTVSDNSASVSGGGIENVIGTLNVTNSTVAGNSAATGGAIYQQSGATTVNHGHFSANTDTSIDAYPGIYNDPTAVPIGSLVVNHSTFS
jgi:hypothetical protein